MATVGKSKVLVAKQPKVMIVSTGDELVEVNEQPKDYQIRRSNVHTLVAVLGQYNISTDTAHIVDSKEVLKNRISSFLNDYDVLLFSGAVSKGKFDFIPEILEELKVEKLFHKVAQRPGKPFWFGRTASYDMSERDGDKPLSKVEESRRNTVVFAFPGNPISTVVSCLKYFVPWWKKSVRLDWQNRTFAVLTEDVVFKPSLTYFLQVKLENKEGVIKATPNKGNGSGDLANLVDTDGFLELPSNRSDFKKGDVFPVITQN